jgi:hypothetical protein
MESGTQVGDPSTPFGTTQMGVLTPYPRIDSASARQSAWMLRGC